MSPSTDSSPLKNNKCLLCMHEGLADPALAAAHAGSGRTGFADAIGNKAPWTDVVQLLVVIRVVVQVVRQYYHD